MATTKKKTSAKKKPVVKPASAKKATKTVATKAVAKKKTVARAKPKSPARKPSTAKAAARRRTASTTAKRPARRKALRPAQRTAADTNRYDPARIEPQWQKRWEKDRLYRAVIDPNRQKYYALTMLPYPSGNLHIGHWYAMAPSDARARWLRMRGYNVMFPMGFDAFGLPAENAAIKDGVHPKKRTYANIQYMRQQMRMMGTMFDWEREAISCDPEYYQWTEWFFIQLFKHGLAYKKMSPVDWCPNCNTTLAREQVWGDDRHCERCGTPVIKKNLEQWYFRTTKYADELLSFEGIDWPEKVRDMQTNWVGRSEGAEVTFPVISHQSSTLTDDSITVFTTRPDTLWGATFMVLAPEHPLVAKLTTDDRRSEVEAYVARAIRETDIERESTEKEKTGVFIGAYAINPVSDERIPIWIADYVLMTYGTGAIMAVPSGDQRDFEFARQYGLNIIPVVAPNGVPEGEHFDGATMTQAYDGAGMMINSGPLNGLISNGEKGRKNPAIDAAIRYIESRGAGKEAVTYRLRDWLISRQRYWGSPIPIVYCPQHGQVPVPDEQLPVTLPDDVEWLPTGQSPLKLHPTWSKTTCPICGQPAVRDTDTMDTFMCSSWYHLRYLSPHYNDGPFDPQEYDYWMPVDTYTGGAEHATMHLIYTRFFHKALRDMGIVEGHEPMMQLRNQGQILGPDGQRMSKSRGNVIDPDEQVRLYGADVVRAYLMFGYQWSEGGPWSTDNIQGVVRWVNRLWTIVIETAGKQGNEGNADDARALRRATHQTIKRVSDDFERFQFNTVVSALMELTNALYKYRDALAGTPAWEEAIRTLLLLAAPVIPHITEELWQRSGEPYSIHTQSWPAFDPAIAAEDMLTVVVQVNGKVRDRVSVPADTGDEQIKAAALASEGARKYMDGKPPKNVVYVKGRLVNIVV